MERAQRKMHFDPLTLMVPDTVASAVAGLLLLGAWLVLRCGPALLWWAAANGIYAIALAALTVGLAWQVPLIVMVGVGLTTIVPALIWGASDTSTIAEHHWRFLPPDQSFG